MNKASTTELTNLRKAAIVLTLIGADVASKVIHFLEESQVEMLSLELARLDKITPQQREVAIQEFHEMAMAQDFISEGGIDQARRLLESAYGEEKANEMLKRIIKAMQVVPFDFLKKADPAQLLSFIQDEHPQTIALILSFMSPKQAAEILTKLPTDIRAVVAERIAMMEQTPPEVIRKVEQVLERKVSSVLSQEMSHVGGPKALVDLLNVVDRGTERVILENLSESNAEMATIIKNMMFVFEDLVQLDNKAIQAVLKEVDAKDLGIALKKATPEVEAKVFANMSERAKGMLKEDMEMMGPVKLTLVEESQQKIVNIVRLLEEKGDITITRGGEADVMI